MQRVLKNVMGFSSLRAFGSAIAQDIALKQLPSDIRFCKKYFLSPAFSPSFQQLALIRSVINHGTKPSGPSKSQEDKTSQIQSEVFSTQPVVGTVIDSTYDAEKEISDEVIKCVNEQISSGTHGRLFAIVHIAGKQFKVTAEDMIVVQTDMPVKTGDKLILEKILLVGSKDFTLVGHPLLSKEMIRIDATVIEKTLSQVKYLFRMKPRKQFRRLRFIRNPYTVLRINNISFHGLLDKKPPVEGVRGKIF